ncbi:NAD(P)-dependent oxidoreductase [Croceicoccus sp. YJ47]|uniref:NAD(P)-dependent oxidoreductase n=1 Tax=Croceicoccus sp. YJ47 TaxID=2798724 RepID=UPI0019206D7E|nr:NAD(P)H-binding protein [Croceicoccus sp. YJ47]QQN75195.1 NAD(P)H-binding protein [Croceicoccus sp. YJ47]
MTDTRPIAVFGAGGKTGTELLRRALARDIPIRAFEHTVPGPDERVGDFEYIECDVLSDDFAGDLDGCRAVISTLGVAFGPGNAIDPPPLYTDGTRNLLGAMAQAKIDRIAVISAAFVEHQSSVPAWFELTAKPALFNILEQMRAMEAMLSDAQGIKWTTARPGWLLDEPYTGEAVITDERLAEGCFRCRHADLAASLLEFVCEDTWINAKPAIGRPEAEHFESPATIKAELGID